MGSGRSTTRADGRRAALAGLMAVVALAGAGARAACDKPVYLTLDTGHMGVAPLVAEVLARQQVRVTFFLANEKTLTGGSSLDDQWAPWWKARAAEGHAFGSHTWDHGYWRADLPGGRFRIRQTFGPEGGRQEEWSAAQYCEDLRRPARRLQDMTGVAMLPLFRAPGGKTSPALLRAAQACGFRHVPWAAAGFLGDELPSEGWPNDRLLQKALRDIRAGDILLAHLGIWSRKDAWAPAVLEPLVSGLKERGFCFATLREHPDYRDWLARSAAPPTSKDAKIRP